MKRSLIALALALGTGLSFAQAEKADDSATAPKKQYNIDIANLPEAKRKEFFEHYFRSEQLFGQKRIFECLESIRKAHQIYRKSPATLNLQGACYVEFRNFKKATESFSAAQKADPKNRNVLFNLAEIKFVSQEWPEALSSLNNLLDNHGESFRQGMKDLIRFKILLCQLKTDQVAEAKATINALSYKDDTPLFYFGNAAISYHAEKTTEAEQWLARGRRVFKNPQLLAPWSDTLIEYGYIKSFYGGDLEVE